MPTTPPRRPFVPVTVVRGRPQEVELAAVRPNPYQPRLRTFTDYPGLASLVDDLRKHGFRGTTEVRRNPADPAGHRRVEAATRAGLTRVLAQFVAFTDEQMRQSALRENLLREELTPREEAVFLQGLRADGLTYDEIAAYVGTSKGWVQARLRPPALEGPLRAAAMADPARFTVLSTLVSLDPSEREARFARVQAGELGVEDLRALVRSRDRDRAQDGPIDAPVPTPEPSRRGRPRRHGRPPLDAGPASGTASTSATTGTTADEALRAVLGELAHLKRLLPFVDPARLSPEERRRIREDLAAIGALWGRLLGEWA